MNKEHLQKIARLGGLARARKWGNPGTAAGRRLGGLRSIKANNRLENNFQRLQKIQPIKETQKLAELFGILMGDGHLGLYQTAVVTNSETDMEHAHFVMNLMKGIFNLPVSIKPKRGYKAVTVLLSSKSVCNFLERKGMPRGNKIKLKMRVPNWIKRKKAYMRAFIRGLFDTDGCVFLDHHIISLREYNNLGWTITSNADRFINDVEDLMRNLGFAVTHRKSQNSVFLRRHKEIERYFSIIGTNNQKHFSRYQLFIKK